ncbi:L-type lectin-domain containing receptor kinase S.4 [Acorus gramineus]|uniref:non-specific serine/threonine protein kinase n=1 Tax=Acorus gramineus TaxID=55184 RepID=A0AAV9AL05_ACOGR|nr:L-type lectin-domain containing receptor kinase S.4 [Acorus gramineus]
MSRPLLLIWVSLLLPLLTSSQKDEFFYSGFNSPGTNISLNGIAQIDPNKGFLRLTNETSRLIGHAFYPPLVRFKDPVSGSAFSFSTSFAFAIVPEYPKLGGHGFAFTISPSKNLPGAQPSQYLGLFNASDNGNFTNHVFAIEFDTVKDFEFFDINDNHVGINIDGMRSNASVAAAYFDGSGANVSLNLKSGDPIMAWIDYDGSKKLVGVSLSKDSSKPNSPILTYAIDLSPILDDSMYVGFSAATGLLASSHYVYGWSFKVNGQARPLDLSALPLLPKPKKTNIALIASVSGVAVVLVVIAVFASVYLAYKIKTRDVIETWELTYGPHRFSYKELKRATRGFSDKEVLGFGGFGKVYRGTLSSPNKIEVAVKRVSHGSKQGLREFVAEIASIGRLRHRNLVQLQGWCRRRGDLLLVYDYMPNGSLDNYLFTDDAKATKLDWERRLKIIRDVAAALLYLHEEWENVVIHRDVKASNVLLDAEMNGRLGDFGLAKLYEHGANPCTTTRVVGTLGYLAPELTRSGRATTGSDVFAYGALVLEVVCGRRPIEPKAEAEELVLVDWVWERWREGRGLEVVDARLKGEFVREEAEIALKVGLMASHPVAAERPSMRDVVRYLGGDAGGMPEMSSPPLDPEEQNMTGGFEDFVHSFPSSSFGKMSLPISLLSARD